MMALECCDVLEQEYLELAGKKDEDFDPAYRAVRDEHRAKPHDVDLSRRRFGALCSILSRAERSALCFSGGGIRSATFCLGALQGLAHHGLLHRFDYLSTVSGGGYIGGWLTAWLQRGSTIEQVTADLKNKHRPGLDGELPAINHLRSYSNYLSPQVGLLSADTWTVAATIVRNMLLNWFILVPLLAAVMLVPRFFLAVGRIAFPAQYVWVSVLAGFLACAYAVMQVGRALPSVGKKPFTQIQFIKNCLAPLILSAILLTASWEQFTFARTRGPIGLSAFAAFGALVHAAGWMVVTNAFHKRVLEWSFFWSGIAGALGGVLGYAVATRLPNYGIEIYTVLAVPALLTIYCLATSLFVGFASRWTNDEDREWWARSGAWIMIFTAGWLVLSAIAVLGPNLLWKLKAAIAAGGFTLGGLGSLFGLSSRTPSGKTGGASEKSEKKTGLIAALFPAIAPIAFLIGLLIAISWVSEEVLIYLNLNPVPETAVVLVWIAGSGLVAYIMGHFVNINNFSLHAMYRARLIRAYLGATNPNRTPNPFTGFDPGDNIPLHELKPGKPFHIINTALNLVKGERLSWQQRKAESFTFSRLHCGSARVGYQPSSTFGNQVSLGTAMAISGAAASPNCGYHSSPLLTFLMTFFNARLGWWYANPGQHGKGLWELPGPANATRAFIDEALGLTNAENPYVYLSDGGHFENLGIYEMIMRRCKCIVAIDAGADPDYHFEDLANAVRKIRVDFGVSIRMQKPMQIGKRCENNLHCAIGEIDYSCVDTDAEASRGILVYIKPSLNLQQPVDIDHYYFTDERFPQQPTSDQFFDEAQFESYRRLGLETIEAICDNNRTPIELQQLADKVGQAQPTSSSKAFRAGC